jgi:hypothetical protein
MFPTKQYIWWRVKTWREVDFCKQGNEPSYSLKKGGKFLAGYVSSNFSSCDMKCCEHSSDTQSPGFSLHCTLPLPTCSPTNTSSLAKELQEADGSDISNNDLLKWQLMFWLPPFTWPCTLAWERGRWIRGWKTFLIPVPFLGPSVKLSLCFKRASRHENILGEWRYSSTHSSTSALDGGEWSASRPGRFTAGERAPGTHWIGGWVGPRAVLEAVVKRKIPSPRRQSNPRNSIVQPVAQRYTDWAITALLRPSVRPKSSRCRNMTCIVKNNYIITILWARAKMYASVLL